MYYKKADIIMSSVLTVIISVIVLILLLFLFTNFFENPQGKYDRAGIACSTTFNNIPSAFNDEESLREYFKVSSQMCISKTVETQNVVKEVSSLLDSCWQRSGSGEDFLPNSVSDLSVCVYCGSVVTQNDGDLADPLRNLLEDNHKDIFGISNFESTNSEYLLKDGNLPTKYREGQELGVFFYLARASSEEGIGLSFDRFLSRNSGLYREFSEFSQSSIPSIGGLLIANIQRGVNSNELGSDINIASDKNLGNLQCDILVLPEENVIINN